MRCDDHRRPIEKDLDPAIECDLDRQRPHLLAGEEAGGGAQGDIEPCELIRRGQRPQSEFGVDRLVRRRFEPRPDASSTKPLSAPGIENGHRAAGQHQRRREPSLSGDVVLREPVDELLIVSTCRRIRRRFRVFDTYLGNWSDGCGRFERSRCSRYIERRRRLDHEGSRVGRRGWQQIDDRWCFSCAELDDVSGTNQPTIGVSELRGVDVHQVRRVRGHLRVARRRCEVVFGDGPVGIAGHDRVVARRPNCRKARRGGCNRRAGCRHAQQPTRLDQGGGREAMTVVHHDAQVGVDDLLSDVGDIASRSNALRYRPYRITALHLDQRPAGGHRAIGGVVCDLDRKTCVGRRFEIADTVV